MLAREKEVLRLGPISCLQRGQDDGEISKIKVLDTDTAGRIGRDGHEIAEEDGGGQKGRMGWFWCGRSGRQIVGGQRELGGEEG